MRLVGMEIRVPAEETIAKWNDPEGGAAAELVMSWQPLSFAYSDGGVATNRFNATFKLDATQREAVRLHGMAGVPKGKAARDSSKDGKFPLERWFRKFEAATGSEISVGDNGQPTSKYIGRVFAVSRGQDSFPGVDSTYDRYMIYPLELADSYTPPAEVPTFVRERKDVAANGVEAAPVVSNEDALKQAAQAFAGIATSKLATSEQQLIWASDQGGNNPIFLTSELQEAAMNGKLVEVFIGKGLISETGGILA